MRRTAALLGRRAAGRKALPPLLFFTDPVRTPDPEAVAAALPAGSAVVLRTFGAPDAEAQAHRLLAIARARRLKLLIGADAALAARVGAHGVHLPQRLAFRARPLKAADPRWTVTAAAHSLRAARAALASGADAAVVSVAFASNSPSAGRAIGPVRLARLARDAGGPVYALGGINDATARRLADAGLVGLAAVEGLAGLRT
ncbi:thiamine phosphate synthase [Phenylobacterium sp.]|uniref:thiamine phosphate synthase n=1 Tax=Phenylobacterium sp. TaxID=1871053 RepID=UPI0035B35658